MRAIASAIIGVAVAALGYVYRRYRKQGGNAFQPLREYIVDGVKYYLGRYVRRQLAAEFSLRKYARQSLMGSTRQMVVPATYPLLLEIDHAYVPLLARTSTGTTLDPLTILDKTGERLVIVGEPGSGKSTLVKRLFREACRNATAAPRRAQMPILVELRRITPSSDTIVSEDIESAVRNEVERTAVYRSTEAIDHLKAGAGLLILLDGLDEIATDQALATQEGLLNFARDMAASSPNSTVIVTTRTQHYLTQTAEDFLRSFASLEVQPFSTLDVHNFLDLWPYSESPRRHAARLFARIRRLPSLREMCTNPLALAMYVARDQQTGGSDLPDTRTGFYHAVVLELLVKRRQRTQDEALGRKRLLEARQRILGEVCLSHVLDLDQTPNSIPLAAFRSAIAQSSGMSGGEEAYDDAIDRLSIDTGLFTVERAAESVRFIHLTLCEFIAALEVIERGPQAWARVLSLLRSPDSEHGRSEPRLAELVAFTLGLSSRHMRNQMFRDLVALGDRPLLVRAAMESQEYSIPETVKAILAECEDVAFAVSRADETNWLPRVRMVVTALIDAATTEGPAGENLYPSASGYLASLMSSDLTAERIIGILARVDPESAIVAADTPDGGLLRQVVAGSADDLALLWAIVARRECWRAEWRVPLLEAALQQLPVARTMASLILTADEAMRMAPERSAGSRQWSHLPFLRDSLYGAILDWVGVDLRSTTGTHSPQASAAVASLTPPRSLGSPFVPGAFAAIGLTVGVVGAVAFRRTLFGSILSVAAGSVLLVVAAGEVAMRSAPVGLEFRRAGATIRQLTSGDDPVGVGAVDTDETARISSSHGLVMPDGVQNESVGSPKAQVFAEILNLRLRLQRFPTPFDFLARSRISVLGLRLRLWANGIGRRPIAVLTRLRELRQKLAI